MSPDPHQEFNFGNIPGWVHACWVSLLALIWKGKPFVKGAVGLASVGIRMDEAEGRILKLEQVNVSKTDIDALRADLQNTNLANHTDLKNDLRFMFGDFKKDIKEDIYKRYDTLDGMIGRIKKAQEGSNAKPDPTTRD